MKIDITEMQVLSYQTHLVAIVSVLCDDALAIHDIKIIQQQGKEKYFLAFPSRINKNGMFENIVHPTTEKMRRTFNKKVLDAFFIEKNKQMKDEEKSNENISSN